MGEDRVKEGLPGEGPLLGPQTVTASRVASPSRHAGFCTGLQRLSPKERLRVGMLCVCQEMDVLQMRKPRPEGVWDHITSKSPVTHSMRGKAEATEPGIFRDV